MRVNGYRCDGCGGEHLVDPNQSSHRWYDGLPNDWFVVTLGLDHFKSHEPWVFCSIACLRSHPFERQQEVRYTDAVILASKQQQEVGHAHQPDTQVEA